MKISDLNPLDYYKAPFHKGMYDSYIWTYYGEMVFNPIGELFNSDGGWIPEVKQLLWDIVAKLNGKMIRFEHQFCVSDSDPTVIMYNNQERLLIRGWGHLTGIGGLNLDGDTAAAIQDSFRDWCIKRLNSNSDNDFPEWESNRKLEAERIKMFNSALKSRKEQSNSDSVECSETSENPGNLWSSCPQYHTLPLYKPTSNVIRFGLNHRKSYKTKTKKWK